LVRIGRRPKAPPWLRWLRDFYPILLYFGFYAETWVMNRMTGAARLDPWLMRADQAVFGCQPAEAFMAVCSHPWLGELLHVSYLSFYLMVGGVGFWLSVQNRRAFGHFVTVVSLVFYACYAIYLFVPAVGPRVLYADPRNAPSSSPPTAMLRDRCQRRWRRAPPTRCSTSSNATPRSPGRPFPAAT
jgi:hypothetical protein